MAETSGRLYPDTLPDILAKDLSVVFCGINPGLQAAQTGHHFAGKNNRFWPIIHQAGFTPVQISPENDREIIKYRCGLTTVVGRPTASAAELSSAEFMDSAETLERKIRLYAPCTIAFLGKAAYATLLNRQDISWGPQSERFGTASVWVLPNPSGRNRSFSMAALVAAYHELYLSEKR